MVHHRVIGWLLIAGGIEFLEVHGPDGQEAFINIHEVSSLRAPTAADLGRHFAPGTKCVVVTTNGKFLAVVETCAYLRDMLMGGRKF